MENSKWVAVKSAEEFFKLINLHSLSLEQVKECVQKGNYDTAIECYVNILKARLKDLPYETRARSNDEIIRLANELLDNKISLLGAPPQDVTKDGKINWTYYPNGDMQWQSHLGYMQFTSNLIDAFLVTKDKKYLDKWEDILLQFLENHPYDTPDLSYSTAFPMYESEYMPVTGGEGFCPDYIGGSWISLACAARSDSIIAGMSAVIGYDIVDNITICNLIASIMGPHLNIMIANPRKGTPNQFLHVSAVLTTIGTLFSEFFTAPAAYLVGLDYYEQAIGKCILPDGTDLEQSFNYNTSLPRSFNKLHSFEPLKNNLRIKKITQKIEKRCEFLALSLTPLGNYPDIAKTHASESIIPVIKQYTEYYDVPLVNKILNVLQGKIDDSALPKTVHFPYGGYSVFRSGWDKKAVYALSKYSRYSPGHKHDDANGFTLTAYGKNLLLDSGHFNYSDDDVSRKINACLMSATAHNTVTVDDKNQNRMTKMEKKNFVDERNPNSTTNEQAYKLLHSLLKLHETPCDANQKTLENYEYLISYYKDGYDDLDVTYSREVFFVKNKFFILRDNVLCHDGQPHKFSSHWHLASDVVHEELELLDNGFVTTQIGNPNVYVTEISSKKLELKTYYATEDPYRGWYVLEYDDKCPAIEVEMSYTGSGMQSATYVVYPFEGDCNPPNVTMNKNGFNIEFMGEAFDI